MPNGRRRKQNLPNGVIKVVNRDESGESGICQNPPVLRKNSILLPELTPALLMREGVVLFSHLH